MSSIKQLFLGGSPAGGYQIERSLRFNSADSAYLNRTPASAATNSGIWTISFWCKRSTLGTLQRVIATSPNSGTNVTEISFQTDNTLYCQIATSAGGGASRYMQTTQVFRDVGAWMHFVLAFDRNQATASNRLRLYVNGTEVIAFSTDQRSSIANTDDSGWNTQSIAQYIGRAWTAANYIDSYLTEFYSIDGQQLTPSSFGETDSATGVWKPKKFSGTYGTNGFYLNFSDNSNTTSTTLGKDSSGNGNNWTPNLFSVTAGAGNDSLVDTPTSYGTDTGVGGEVRGNYATWNPLDKDDGITSVTEGNLKVVTNGSNGSIKSTIVFPSGKWYWEVTSDSINASGTQAVGIMPQSQPPTNNMSDSGKLGYALDVSNSDRKFENGTATSYGTYTQANGAIYMLAFDQDAGKLWYGIDGTWLASGAPASGTNPSSSSIPTTTAYCAAVSDNTVSGTFTVNFGQRAFSYTAPSGFKALCTQNLPTPTIGATSTTQANRYMDAKLWAGNGSTQSISSYSFAPDFAWIKSKGDTQGHVLYDTARPVGNYLMSNNTDDEESLYSMFTAWNSDGFSLSTTGGNNTNGSTRTYVGWAWKANGTGVSNTSGTITSTVSANTTSGFSIVTYTGNGTTGTVGHGLGVTPSMIIVKSRSTAQRWTVFHTSTSNAYIYLNETFAADTTNANVRFGNNTSVVQPTSTLFTIGSSADVNQSTTTYVAYCFAAVAGYSAFGSYTGNGDPNGTFVYTGFRPRWIMIKNATTGGAGYNWFMYDTTRDTYNLAVKELYANLTDLEDQSSQDFDILSNGFKFRGVVGAGATNGSGQTYIYAAFAESPFKYSLAR